MSEPAPPVVGKAIEASVLALFDLTTDGLCILDVAPVFGASTIVLANSAFGAQAGTHAEDLPGVRCFQLPGVMHPLSQAVLSAERTGKVQTVEDLTVQKRWFLTICIPLEPGRVALVRRDITHAQQELERNEQSRARFQLVAEHSSDIVCCTSGPDWAIDWMAPSAQTALGWPVEEMAGKPLGQYVHDDDAGQLATLYRAVEADGASSAELRLRCADGSYRWVAASVRLAQPLPGDPALVVVGMRLIESERRARALLRRNEARLQAVLDSLLDPHMVLQAMRDKSGTIVDFLCLEANDAACRFVGLPYLDTVGSRLSDVLPGHAIGNLMPAFAEVVESGEPLILDEYRVAADAPGRGTGNWFDVRAVRLEDGLSLTWRDITERFAGQQRLHASEELLRLTLESVPTGIAVLDLTGRFLEASPTFCRLLGRDREWLLRHAVGNVLFPGEGARFRHMVGLVTSGAAASQETRQRFVNAAGVPVEAVHSVAVLRGAEGAPVGLVCHMRPASSSAEAESAEREPSIVARTSVLVASDDTGIFPAMATTALLAQQPEVIVMPPVTAGPDLRRRLANDTPDVLVVMAAPGTAGHRHLSAVVADLEAVQPSTGLVVVSFTSHELVELTLRQRSGPSAFLPISVIRDPEVLVQTIETVARGMGAFDPTAAAALLGRSPVRPDSQLTRLTDREREVLDLLASGLDNQTIAARLFISVKAAENYISSIFRKLDLNDDDGTNRRVRAALLYLGEL